MPLATVGSHTYSLSVPFVLVQNDDSAYGDAKGKGDRLEAVRWFVGVLLVCVLLAGGSSSSGDRIAFVSDRDGDDEILVMNADGTEVRQLTDNDDKDWVPSWSPGGDRIAFMSARGGDWEIFVMNADGTEARQLTDNDDSDTGPSWSPGGDRIVFTSNRDGD